MAMTQSGGHCVADVFYIRLAEWPTNYIPLPPQPKHSFTSITIHFK